MYLFFLWLHGNYRLFICLLCVCARSTHSHVILCIWFASWATFLTWGSLTFEILYPFSSGATEFSQWGFSQELFFLRASLSSSYCILMCKLQSHRRVNYVRGRSAIKYLKALPSRGFIKTVQSFICQTWCFFSLLLCAPFTSFTGFADRADFILYRKPQQ